MSTVKYWLWLAGLRGLRPRTRNALLERFGTPEAVFFASEADYAALEGLNQSEREALAVKDPADAMRALDLCAERNISILTLQDAAYPDRLRNIYDPPLTLFVRGRLPSLDEEAAVAILGTRRATPYGLKMGQRLGYEITKCGGLVISAMTAGVDRAGVQGALRAGGSCIGVLATPVDESPPGLRGMYEDVAAVGALISEYPPGTSSPRSNFLERNRLTSGVSVGVVVVEAPESSGTLLVAELASEQGRDVFAVPGNADSENCAGTNGLIKEGAKAVTAGWDVMCEYERRFPGRVHDVGRAAAVIPQESTPEPPPEQRETGRGFAKLREAHGKKVVDSPKTVDYIDLRASLEGLTPDELTIVSVMDRPAMHIDDIIEAAGLPSPVVLSELTLLQIQGIVAQEPGKRFTLNVQKRGNR